MATCPPRAGGSWGVGGVGQIRAEGASRRGGFSRGVGELGELAASAGARAERLRFTGWFTGLFGSQGLVKGLAGRPRPGRCRQLPQRPNSPLAVSWSVNSPGLGLEVFTGDLLYLIF